MKKELGKYGFEIVVIFIGITASFIFEEWRQGREKQENANNIMNSLIVELERNDEYIKSADTTYVYIDSLITACLKGDNIKNEDVMNLTYSLLEEVSYYQLKDVSSFVYGFSSLDPVIILKKNEDIITYMSYLNSLLSEHQNITSHIYDQSSKDLWPLLRKYEINEDLINYLRTEPPEDSLIFVGKDQHYADLMRDDKFREHISWSQLKIMRLSDINNAIHRRIKDINEALKTAIEE